MKFLIVLSAFSALLSAADGPQFTADGKLMRPADYRSWPFLSSSLGLQYGPNAPASPRFENVYVNPPAWKEFQKSGKWPDGTIFVLELRAAVDKGTFAKGGQYQGEVVGMELEVKDSKRFPDEFVWFDLPKDAATAKAFAKTESCFACHSENGAVEKTFVQFYPTAMEIAKAKGTLKIKAQADR